MPAVAGALVGLENDTPAKPAANARAEGPADEK